jgi:hypothetical protein
MEWGHGEAFTNGGAVIRHATCHDTLGYRHEGCKMSKVGRQEAGKS